MEILREKRLVSLLQISACIDNFGFATNKAFNVCIRMSMLF